jgi:hypothetical protein
MKPHPEKAVDFNNEIVLKQDTFYSNLNDFFDLMEHSCQDNILEKKYNDILIFSKKTENYYRNLSPFDNEDVLRNATIEFFNSQNGLIKNELAEIKKLYFIDYEEISIEHENMWDSLINRITYLDSVYINKFLYKQDSFANKYQIKLNKIDK